MVLLTKLIVILQAFLRQAQVLGNFEVYINCWQNNTAVDSWK